MDFVRGDQMDRKNIVVVGASAGGFEALKTLISGLPANLQASIFVVWHIAPDIRGVLPRTLNKVGALYAQHAVDREPIKAGRIYVAPPDRHMLVDDGHLRVTRGPKENRFRPAIDPLFRSAAYHYGPNVIGIILSGALHDGTSGLWTVKHRGGTAVVQDPMDAEVRSMPENAIREVIVDHVLPVAEMPELIVRLIEQAQENPRERVRIDEREDAKTKLEILIATEASALQEGVMTLGEGSPYSCPECHGVLLSIRDGEKLKRFRCHTGHAFSADGLLSGMTDQIESSLWAAIRGLDETIVMLNNVGDHYAAVNEPKVAAQYFQKANEAARRNEIIRKVVVSHEQLSKEAITDDLDTDAGLQKGASVFASSGGD